MASLFGKNRLREIANRIETDSIRDYVMIVQTWYDDYLTGTLKHDKETSREQSYNQDFFIKILGFKEKPVSPFSFVPKETSEKGQLPDAVIGYTGATSNINQVSAVVELKGASVDLDRPQRRDGNLSPVQQGFKYKPQFRNCPFVIVSNFWEFRLYHDNLLDYESWTLADLTNPKDDYLLFKTWYVLLNQQNFISKTGKSKTENLLTDIRVDQEEIGREFYKVYKDLRLELLRDMYRNNDSIKRNIDMGIKKAQKIIDRIVFACFAEDRGLLPDNTLLKVVRAADHSVYGGSLWNTFKDFFDAIDRGSEKLDIPDGYNGGLFKKDDKLNNLQVSDDSLRKLAALGKYDFDEDLSVSILGHIFEQSISDLEEIKNKVYLANDLEGLSYNRRKKDGIFYTPDYIVKHIVDRTLGAYLRSKEEELKIKYGLKGDITDKTYQKREQDAYVKYYEFLSNVKVVDPACGSGAFLVYVFDYLLADHIRVGKILGLNKGVANFDQVYRNILQRNIYGVDLNEESVEITKLSLWLKSALKGKKLTSLDKNIKCGNSLVTSPNHSKRYFDWRSEFPEIFNDGGFDIVIGNPPYVKEYTAKEAFDGTRSNPVYQGKMDLWYLFGSLALDIVKPETGYIGYIAPNNWVTNSGASNFRNRILSDGKLVEFSDFGDYKVFDQAGIQTMIYVMKRSADNNDYTFDYAKVINSKINAEDGKDFLSGVDDSKFIYHPVAISKKLLLNSTFNFNDASIEEIIEKIKTKGTLHFEEKEISTGIDVHQDYVNKKSKQVLGDGFEIGQGIFNLSTKEITAKDFNDLDRSLLVPFYTTDQLHRYYADKNTNSWLIYTDSSYKNPRSMDNYPGIKEHLDRLQLVITSDNKPYGLHRARNREFFVGPKVISLRKCQIPTFTYTDFDAYVSQTYMVIKSVRFEPKYLTGLLNSRLIEFWLKYKGKIQGELYQIDKDPLLKLPLLKSEKSSEITNLVEQIIANSQELRAIERRFLTLLSKEFGIKKLPNKQGSWWDMPFEDFITLLKIKASLQKLDEFLKLFNDYSIDCKDISIRISSAEKEIDQMVYSAYGLAYDDVQMIESLVRR